MERLWSTSAEVIRSLTGFPTGTRSTVSCFPFSYSKVQDHCRAVTLTGMASGGTVRMYWKPFHPDKEDHEHEDRRDDGPEHLER